MNFLRRVWQHLVNPDSSHGQIAKGFFWVSLFVVVGKFAGAAKEMTIAWRYGVSAETDAYLYVYNLINWPVAVWANALTVVLVPLVARASGHAPRELSRFRAELLGATLVGATLLLVLAWFGLPRLLVSSWAGLGAETLQWAQAAYVSMVWLLPLGALTAVYAAWMMGAGHHANSLLESVPALVILLVLLLVPAPGLTPLLWGTVAGAALHLLVLSAMFGRRGEFGWPRVLWTSPHWRSFVHGFALALVGQVVMGLIGLVDQFFAAHLGAGAVATYSYASRVLALVLALGATAVGRATMPVFSAALDRDERGTRRVVGQWGGLMFVLGLLTMGVAIWTAPWVVQLLFERGRFTAEDSAAVTEVLRHGLLQLPFYAAGLVYVSWLTSRRSYMTILLISGCNLVVKIFANLLLIPVLGLTGLMLSTVIMLGGSLALLVYACRRA